MSDESSKSLPIITVGGPDLTICAGGHDYTFEMHDYCGPFVLGKRGDPLKNQPAERDPFWVAFTAWDRQGRRVIDGRCVWDKPKPHKVLHLGGKHYEVVESGDGWFDGIEVISAAEAAKIRLLRAGKDRT